VSQAEGQRAGLNAGYTSQEYWPPPMLRGETFVSEQGLPRQGEKSIALDRGRVSRATAEFSSGESDSDSLYTFKHTNQTARNEPSRSSTSKQKQSSRRAPTRSKKSHPIYAKVEDTAALLPEDAGQERSRNPRKSIPRSAESNLAPENIRSAHSLLRVNEFEYPAHFVPKNRGRSSREKLEAMEPPRTRARASPVSESPPRRSSIRKVHAEDRRGLPLDQSDTEDPEDRPKRSLPRTNYYGDIRYGSPYSPEDVVFGNVPYKSRERRDYVSDGW